MARKPTDGKTHPHLLLAEEFEGFGASSFRAANEPIVGRKISGKRPSRLLRGVREYAPKWPGVYAMLDERKRIVYVGKAKNLRSRLLSYFRVESRDPKAGRILQHTRTLVWEQASDEFAALLRELELIQRLCPRFNVLGRPGFQRHHYLCVGKSPAPYVYVSTTPNGKELGCYGPLTVRNRSEDAARRLNDWFKLRDCPQTVPLVFADQPALFPEDRAPKCLRFEIGNCAGPCVGACTRTDYTVGARAAKAFLDGRDRSLLQHIRELMDAAVAGFAFEKAVALRDRLSALEWVDNRLSLLRKARTQASFIYPLTGSDGKERWYLIHRGQVRAVAIAPECESERLLVSALIERIFSSRTEPAVLSDVAVDSVLLVAAWFRKNPEEREKLVARSKLREMG